MLPFVKKELVDVKICQPVDVSDAVRKMQILNPELFEAINFQPEDDFQHGFIKGFIACFDLLQSQLECNELGED